MAAIKQEEHQINTSAFKNETPVKVLKKEEEELMPVPKPPTLLAKFT
jgi:hypothetical protein